MKYYYKATKKLGDTVKVTYWKGEQAKAETFLSKSNYDFIIPLGTRKPRNVASEDIMLI